MREHIRREAGQFVDAGWWLVPVAFAIAALAAVAMGAHDNDDDALRTQAAAALPMAQPAPSEMIVPAATTVPAAPSQPEPIYEVEHVQAF